MIFFLRDLKRSLKKKLWNPNNLVIRCLFESDIGFNFKPFDSLKLSKYALINKAAWRYVQLSDGSTLEGVRTLELVFARDQDLPRFLTPIVGLWGGNADPVQKYYCAFHAKNDLFVTDGVRPKLEGNTGGLGDLDYLLNIPSMEPILNIKF